MQFPGNTHLGTVRSTVLLVALLASAFIVFDSYNWHLLSISWSQTTLDPSHSESRSRTDPKITPNSPAIKTEDRPTKVTTLDGLSNDDDNAGDETEIADNRRHSAKNDSVPGDSVELTKEKQILDSDISDSTERAVTLNSGPAHRAAEPDFHTQSGERPGALPIADAGVDAGTAAPRTTPSKSIAPPNAADPTREAVLPQKPTRRYDELSNIERVELDLWQARSAMRKVVLAQMNSTNADQAVADGDPHGDVYRNVAIFRQSYQEMEQRFKVYIYQEGEEPLVHKGPCKNIYAIEGRFIQELQGDNPYVTTDPEAAHVFFLPFSVAMMVTYLYTSNSGDMSPLLRFAKDYVNVVSRKYPYWTRSDGADHFMLACHDWGPHISRADEKLVSKTIRVLCNANVSEGYVPSKDASLPEIHLVGGRIPAELGGLPASERTVLAFFAGGDHGPVRPDLFKNWEGKDSNILVYHQVPAEGPSYHTYMKSSKYCLCPGGYEVNSPRIVEAIYSDCVPVVIADKFVLPFSDVLDWEMFAVHVLEEDIHNLKNILEAIPMQTYIEMQERIKLVRHHFLLNQPPKRYDVFHMILHSVWLRRLNIQLIR